MTNPIKYSTGTETLALKKGNFYIGTGDVGKGPTSSTGYYNGISPPSGGYTIYLNKETGGPSIYTASNDAQLISLTNSIAGQSYTTANECLVYFAGQTDKMVLNRNYEGIVTDGLVLNLDVGFTPSYPKNGTTWYDVSGSNNGTLTNGPTFDSDNGGSIVFDGADDYIYGTNNANLQLTSDLTVCAWVNLGNNNNQGIFEKMRIGPYNGYGITKQDGYFKFWTASNNLFQYTISNTTYVNDSNWYYVVGRRENGVNRLFINSILQNDSKTPNLSDSGDVYVVGRYYSNANDYYLGGKISNIQVYNRALSASEVLQNYNAQKGRFGL
jgi:hypothetical protein